MYFLTLQVFLEARSETESSVRMLTDEVSQIQEVSVCQTVTRHEPMQACGKHLSVFGVFAEVFNAECVFAHR